MPRRLRSFHEGIYHLAARGSDTRYLFVDDQDRQDFLDRLAATWENFELALLSYVLMGSHYHALVRIPDSRLSPALQRLHTEYSRHHSRRYGQNAHPLAESDLRAAFGDGSDWRERLARPKSTRSA